MQATRRTLVVAPVFSLREREIETATIYDAYNRPIPQRSDLKNPDPWLYEYFAGAKTAAGEAVNQNTAMTVAAFFGCVRNISEDLGKLPKHVRKHLTRGSVPERDHPVQRLLLRPNSYTDAMTFWQTLFAHAVSGQDGFAEIVYKAGYPYELHLIMPDRVKTEQSSTGEITYWVTTPSMRVPIPARYMLHIRGLGYDGVTGFDIAHIGRQIVGAAIALQKFRGSFFGNGASPSGVLKHPGQLDEKVGRRLREQFEARYSGAGNANKTVLLEEGMEWVSTSIDPDRAQMEALTNITGEDICRYYRMPPHKAGFLHRATFSNIEEQNIEYSTDCLDGWRARAKSEMEFKLFTDAEIEQGYYIDISLKGLLRGNAATRAAFYKELYYMGALNADEIREYEEENPIASANGGRYFVQQNLIPLDRVDDALDKATKPAPAEPATPDDTPEESPDDTRARVAESFRMVIEDRIQHNVLRLEAAKAETGKAEDWYYSRHENYVRDNMKPLIDGCAFALGIKIDAEQVASDYAHLHVGLSQSNVASGNIESWNNGARAKAAATIILGMIQKAGNEVTHE